jgi:hypothetical protein
VAEPSRPAIERLVRTMPDSYFLSTPEEVLVDHAELVARFVTREDEGVDAPVAVHWADYPERDCFEVAIATRDRAGLFAMITGVVAAEGLNILAARIATSRDGVALDAFRISRPSDEAALDEERVERLETTLRQVLRGRLEIDELVQRSARPWLRRRRGRRAETTIEIDNEVSEAYRSSTSRPAIASACSSRSRTAPLPPRASRSLGEGHDHGDAGARRVLRDRPRGAEDRGPGLLAAIRDALRRALEPEAATAASSAAGG